MMKFSFFFLLQNVLESCLITAVHSLTVIIMEIFMFSLQNDNDEACTQSGTKVVATTDVDASLVMQLTTMMMAMVIAMSW